MCIVNTVLIVKLTLTKLFKIIKLLKKIGQLLINRVFESLLYRANRRRKQILNRMAEIRVGITLAEIGLGLITPIDSSKLILEKYCSHAYQE